MYYWMKRLRDAIGERRARAAEMTHRRAREADMAKAEHEQQSAATVEQEAQADPDSIVPPPADMEPTAQAEAPPSPLAVNRPNRGKRREGAKA
jgi:hypothetical protein